MRAVRHPRRRARCLADIVADSYDDAEAGCSCCETLDAAERATATCETIQIALEGSSSTQRGASHRPRRIVHSMSHLLVYILAAVVAISLPQIAAGMLFDPGEQSQSSSTAEAVAAATATSEARGKTGAPRSSTAQSVKLVESKGLSALTREPMSIHPACRRMTDLFNNVCPNPWTPFLNTRDKTPRSELIVCPLSASSEGASSPDKSQGSEGRRERVYAITGTITVPEDVVLIPDMADAPSVDAIVPALVATGEAKWPKPGDEGFWRHRDGELEWVPTEPRALIENDSSAASSTDQVAPSEGSASVQGVSADPMQAHEYDVWSASVGGEDSDTWLSFETWRERHLAAEKERMEAERQRHAAERKQKAEKNREANKAQQTASVPQREDGGDAPAKDEIAAEAETSAATPQAGKKESQTETSQGAHSEKSPDDPNDSRATEDPGSQDTALHQEPPAPQARVPQGAIPAIGNPSQELKNLKHRWNFASFDCAAVVHRSNPSARFSSAILSEKKDRYMLSPCPSSSNEEQFVIVELCDEIIVDTLVLANFEFFSRMFKKFRVRVSRSLNGGDGDWVDIGTFRARNIRGLQVFKPVNPPGDARFYRYMRIDFQEHYGNEYYCPVSLLRVYGLTQMDDYVREEEEMRKQREREIRLLNGEDDAEDDVDQGEQEQGQGGPAKSEENIVEKEASSTASASSTEIKQDTSQSTGSQTTPSQMETIALPGETIKEVKDASMRSINETRGSEVQESNSPLDSSQHTSIESDAALSRRLANATEASIVDPIGHGQAGRVANASIANVTDAEQADVLPRNNTSYNSPPNPTTAPPLETPSSEAQTGPSTVIASTETRSKLTTSPTDVAVHAASSGSVESNDSTSRSADPVKSDAPSGNPPASSSTVSSSVASSPSSSQQAGSASNAAQPHQQGGSESIYRAITKRLNALETNATLSLQYMDHSRQMLRETFQRMERNQRDKIGQMLRELNASNWRQIESLKRRQQVDLQQAIFEFDMHRQQTDAERRALLAQVHILSNEVLLEKRFGIAQLVLLIGLFVFMAFTRTLDSPPLLSEGIARLGRMTPPLTVTRKQKRVNDRKTEQEGSSALLNRAQQMTNNGRTTSHGRRDSRELALKPKRSTRKGDSLRQPRFKRFAYGHASKLGRLLIPRESVRPVMVHEAGEDGFAPSVVPKTEETSDSDTSDVKPIVAADCPVKGSTGTISWRHPHPQAALSRNVTLTRDNMLAKAGFDGSPDRKPIPRVKSEFNDLLQVPTADESMNSDWGTERSEDGEESDASSTRAGEQSSTSAHGAKTPAVDADDETKAFDQSREDIHISPRPHKAQVLNHHSTSDKAYRLAMQTGSPPHGNGNGSPVRAFAPSAVDQMPSLRTSATYLAGTRRDGGRHQASPTHLYAMRASPHRHDESDAEEDQPPWNQVQGRRSLRRSTNGTTSSASVEDEYLDSSVSGSHANGGSPSRRPRASLGVLNNGSANSSRLHTPTGPAAPTFHIQPPSHEAPPLHATAEAVVETSQNGMSPEESKTES